jgi:hypothetical protein
MVDDDDSYHLVSVMCDVQYYVNDVMGFSFLCMMFMMMYVVLCS